MDDSLPQLLLDLLRRRIKALVFPTDHPALSQSYLQTWPLVHSLFYCVFRTAITRYNKPDGLIHISLPVCTSAGQKFNVSFIEPKSSCHWARTWEAPIESVPASSCRLLFGFISLQSCCFHFVFSFSKSLLTVLYKDTYDWI